MDSGSGTGLWWIVVVGQVGVGTVAWDRFVVDSGSGTGLLWIVVVGQVEVGTVVLGQVCCG